MYEYFAVIVSYNPDIKRLTQNCRLLKEQGFRVIIVDNGSNIDLEEYFSQNDLIKLGENKGIATALNIGMQGAKERRGSWVLSLDQDTEVASNLLDEYKKYINLQNVGALSPRIVRRGEEEKEYIKVVEEIERCPTSGFFMAVDLWERIGGYDDWMFIDYVDYDICRRIKNNGLHIYRINSTYIIQELGKLEVNPFFDFLGKTLHIKKLRNFAKVYNHSSVRNYYFVRNALYYMYKYQDIIDLKYERGFLLRWEIKKIILEKNKMDNIRSIARGIKDFRMYKRKIDNAK